MARTQQEGRPDASSQEQSASLLWLLGFHDIKITNFPSVAVIKHLKRSYYILEGSQGRTHGRNLSHAALPPTKG